MATVRRSTMEDMPAVTRMTMDFLAISPYDKHMTLDPVALEQQFRVMQDNDSVACFVAEIDGQIVGMLACCVTGCWFNPGVVIASELGWWIEPHARGTTCAVRLLNEFERWGRDKGAVLVAMSSLAIEKEQKVATMLARRGYAPCETTHLKGTF